jgi:uncharacterized membrane protein
MLVFIDVLYTLASILFLGNILVMLAWRWFAEKTRDPKILAFANKTIRQTDRLLLGPSAMALSITVNIQASLAHSSIWNNPRLTAGMVFFILSGVVWLGRLVPIEKQQVKLCEGFADGGPVPDSYFALTKKWFRWGMLAAALALGSAIMRAAQ